MEHCSSATSSDETRDNYQATQVEMHRLKNALENLPRDGDRDHGRLTATKTKRHLRHRFLLVPGVSEAAAWNLVDAQNWQRHAGIGKHLLGEPH